MYRSAVRQKASLLIRFRSISANLPLLQIERFKTLQAVRRVLVHEEFPAAAVLRPVVHLGLGPHPGVVQEPSSRVVALLHVGGARGRHGRVSWPTVRTSVALLVVKHRFRGTHFDDAVAVVSVFVAVVTCVVFFAVVVVVVGMHRLNVIESLSSTILIPQCGCVSGASVDHVHHIQFGEMPPICNKSTSRFERFRFCVSSCHCAHRRVANFCSPTRQFLVTTHCNTNRVVRGKSRAVTQSKDLKATSCPKPYQLHVTSASF